MKKIWQFSKLFFPAMIFSIALTGAGLASYFIKGGFNLGVDFQAGLIQEVQFAPTAFSLKWAGTGNATIRFDRSGLYIINSGVGVESLSQNFIFPFSEYATIGALTQGLGSIEGLDVQLSNIPAGTSSSWLVRSAQGDPQLSGAPYLVHYLDPSSPEIRIETVREALASLGQNVSVQSLGQPQDRHFMIRAEDKEGESETGGAAPAERITNALEGYFGVGEIVILRSDYVGSRFSKNLTDQAGLLMGLTLLVILAYASIRFKPQYALGAVVGIIHDTLVIVAFVIWTGMEFNTSTIAALLTILGYSINNTIVVFDRIRENRRIYPDEVFVNILNRSLSETLSRTIITTVTTMLAVMSLYIFTTGSMKDFALALMIGMISGVYTTTFIASGLVNVLEKQRVKREKQKLVTA